MWKSTSELGYAETFVNLHAIDQTLSQGPCRVDGVGRLTFDFHTGRGKAPRVQKEPQGRPEARQDHFESSSTDKGRRAFVGRSESMRSVIAVASKVSFITMARVAGRRPDAVAQRAGVSCFEEAAEDWRLLRRAGGHRQQRGEGAEE